MKKVLILAAIMLLVAVSAMAQLKVRYDGTVRIGECYPEDTGYILPQYRDSVSALQIYGPTSDPSRARISFGDQMTLPTLNVMVGEQHQEELENSDRLWLHGRHGFAITRNGTANDTLLIYDDDDPVFNFSAPVKSEGVLLTSDERCKQDIRDFDDALATLSNLRGVTYRFKPRESPYANVVPAENEEAVKDYQYFTKLYADQEAARCSKTHYGFIAQELEQVLPDVVETDKNGMKSVDYIAVIPILVNAVNELNARNQELEQQLRALSEPEVSRVPALQPTGVEDILTDRNTEVLGQNDPNPFSSDTRIAYNLPEGTQAAAIYIYDLQGKQVMHLPVAQMGAGSVTINGGNLQAGMYIYALVADGQELEAKRMILTK